MAIARIGLGSNVGDAAGRVARALGALAALGTVLARSSLYRSQAWGVVDQPDFVNAAALLATDLEPHALLDALKALEVRLGRVTTFRWGPRAIDLDILAYDDRRIAEPDLVLPHARLYERAFALVPLAEIDANFADARDALPAADRSTVQRIPLPAARSAPPVDWDETLARVRSAADFCATAGLARVRIEEDEFAIDVRRIARARRPTVAAAPEQLPVQNGRSPSGVAQADPPRSVLRAEFVGIVRLSRPAVAAGTLLAEDRELAYVEALGIRNPVRSGGPGRVSGVFINDGEAVDFGQPLFAIEN